MNSLSILAYFIGVIPNFGTLFVFACIASTALTVAAVIYKMIRIENLTAYYGERLKRTDPQVEDIRKTIWPVIKRGAAFVVFFAFLAAAVPDKNTLTLIAASEISEKVVNNKDVREVLDPSVQYLKNWIQDELRKQKEKMTPAKDSK